MMVEDRVTVSRRTQWTMGNFPVDMLRVEVWDGSGVTVAYLKNGTWHDAQTLLPLANSKEITHWRHVWGKP